MSKHLYHTQPLPPLQEVDLSDETWNHTISTRLPAQLEEQARTLNAWSRQRKLRCATDVLRGVWSQARKQQCRDYLLRYVHSRPRQLVT